MDKMKLTIEELSTETRKLHDIIFDIYERMGAVQLVNTQQDLTKYITEVEKIREIANEYVYNVGNGNDVTLKSHNPGVTGIHTNISKLLR